MSVTAESDDGEVTTITNISGTLSTGQLAPAIFVREGSLDYSSLRNTILIPISPGSVDGRAAPFGGRTGAAFADRVAHYWNVAQHKRPRIERAIAVLTGGRSLVLGDWDVDPRGQWTPPVSVGSRVEIPLLNPEQDDPRGVKGMRLDGQRANPGDTYSDDQRS